MIYGRTNKPYHHVPHLYPSCEEAWLHPFLQGLPQHRLRLHGAALDAVHHHDGAVGDAQGGRHLGSENRVPNGGPKWWCLTRVNWDVLFCGIAAYLDVLVPVYLFELDWIGLISCMFKYRHTLTRLKLHWKAWKATRRKWHSFDSLNCSKKCVLVEHGYQHILTHLHISVYM